MARWTIEEYTTLKAAVASGVLEVRYNGNGGGGDRLVRYQTLSEMRRLLSEMEADLFPAGTNGRSGGRYIATSKGV